VRGTAARAHIASNGFLTRDGDGSVNGAIRTWPCAMSSWPWVWTPNRDGKVTWGELRASGPQLARVCTTAPGAERTRQACTSRFEPLQINDRVDGSYAWLPYSCALPAIVSASSRFRYTLMEGIDPSHRGLLT
jgi:hypothetical protein